MYEGPLGPATDLLTEVQSELVALNEQFRTMLTKVAAGQQAVAPTLAPQALAALAPLLQALASADRGGEREELSLLRKEFNDLGVSMRAIAASAGTIYGGVANHVTIDNTAQAAVPVALSGSGTVGVNNFPVTQPVSGSVSVSNLPATQPVSGTVTANVGTGSLAGITSTVVVKADTSANQSNSLKVDGSAVTQPVSVTSLPLPTGAAADATLTGGTQKSKIVDTGGSTAATVKAASTAVAATDTALAVGLHPTSPLPTGANVIGALTANQSVNNAQVNGAAVVTSATGVQDVMPRKRNGSTGLSPTYAATRVTTNATTNVVASTAYVSTIVVVVSGAGTAWTVKIQNKEATPKILYPATTAAVSVVQFNFSEPVLMTSGIDIVTAGTTAGTVDVFVTYWQ